ncbi:helix-turn-helix domain-containing protein [Chryseobacterium nematophagum]|uniref:Helix-turn-helix domain-containing protein n=1 Tax=Chryseobacterium nematophagum TaxID=2305228 RepID=A0A3M7TIE2_9FLAO|nr:helix-turn-helix domain-containing protein [Chryseobacterium nematophagum]RNA63301.1 helix-turn-helix domain-containing protein [Chryseobacterium nematophagum]
MRPNYHKIYTDIIEIEYPEKLNDPKIKNLLKKLNTTADVLKINHLIFKQSKDTLRDNQKLKIYDKKTIIKLLNYQKKHDFSTQYMARKYKISRTTIAKWRKNFLEEIPENKK